MDPNAVTFSIPFRLNRQVEPVLERWELQNHVPRLWGADSSLWTGADEASWLGWLSVVERQLLDADRFQNVSDGVRQAGFRDVVLVGMGGSSLCPEVLARTFGPAVGHPRLLVLDSTHPERIRSVEDSVRLDETLVVVSSKSGTTLESTLLLDYLLDRFENRAGPDAVSDHIVAITDPGSSLETLGRRRNFRNIFMGIPQIGGRFSALSDYGMIPAALLGIDVAAFLRRAEVMVRACSAGVSAARNPGVALGIVLGVAAREGVDKVTLVLSDAISSFGAWLEQLLAESLGKEGRAVIPVDGEPLAGPEAYGDDRIFVYLRLDSARNEVLDEAMAALEEAGRPVIRIGLADTMDLAQEFFRWEFATAVAGAVMGVNPFDQPDVEATKAATRSLMAAYETSGALPPEVPTCDSPIASVFGGDRRSATLEESLRAHIGLAEHGDYVALLAYLEMSGAVCDALERIRSRIRSVKSNAVTVGFGPRFLHSTGQAHKGGPNTGVFFVFTADPGVDVDIPGRSYPFGIVIGAQARGDSDALVERGRRVLRVHLHGDDAVAGLEALDQAFARALSGA